MVLGFAPNRHDRTADGRRSQKGWIGSRSGPARGRAVSNVPPPQHLCLPLLPPLNRGLLFAWSSMDARYLRGCGCLALIDSCQQEMNAQNGFGQSWMSWSRCLRMPPRQRSMRATCRRREAADGTQRRSSGCASAWALVHVVNRGRGFWRAGWNRTARLLAPARRTMGLEGIMSVTVACRGLPLSHEARPC
jgi:hypothetical protein